MANSHRPARRGVAAPRAHRLYGQVSVMTPYSVGSWMQQAACEISRAREAGQWPSSPAARGLYFEALTNGLSDIPAVTAETREGVAREIEKTGLADAAARLLAEILKRPPKSTYAIPAGSPGRWSCWRRPDPAWPGGRRRTRNRCYRAMNVLPSSSNPSAKYSPPALANALRRWWRRVRSPKFAALEHAGVQPFPARHAAAWGTGIARTTGRVAVGRCSLLPSRRQRTRAYAEAAGNLVSKPHERLDRTGGHRCRGIGRCHFARPGDENRRASVGLDFLLT